MTATLFESNPLYDRLTTLAACLCAEIQNPDNGVPDVCFCGVVPGESVPAEYAGDCSIKCGIAWVRMISAYPSNSVGVLLAEPGNCEFGLGMDIEMGILRCIKIADPDGTGPSPGELLESSQLQAADALVMQRALFCCTEVNNKDVVLGTYQSMGPEGGLVGGAYQMSVAV